MRLKRQLVSEGQFGAMIGSSQVMRELFGMADRIAQADVTVLIQGESGTGKDLLATEIHRRSNRGKGPFVALNCAALPEHLIESELFGFEKGAFTGATAMKRGKFELANGGVLFLDEVGDMSLSTQAKLLRVLETRRVERLGGTTSQEVDVRIVSATNKDLAAEIARQTFREDLYYRLRVVLLHIPALREHREDLPLDGGAILPHAGGETRKVHARGFQGSHGTPAAGGMEGKRSRTQECSGKRPGDEPWRYPAAGGFLHGFPAGRGTRGGPGH